MKRGMYCSAERGEFCDTIPFRGEEEEEDEEDDDDELLSVSLFCSDCDCSIISFSHLVVSFGWSSIIGFPFFFNTSSACVCGNS